MNKSGTLPKSSINTLGTERAGELRKQLAPNQDVIGAGEACLCRKPDGFPIAKPAVLCRRCGDDGIYGGKIGGEYAGEWKWCTCQAATARERAEPSLISLCNEIRGKLLGRKYAVSGSL